MTSSATTERGSETPTELLRTLPRAAYLDDGHFAREVEGIWLREWVCVGREESLPSAGAFLHIEVAGERILVVRGRGGDLRAFANVCRHRGSQLVMEAPPSSAEPG